MSKRRTVFAAAIGSLLVLLGGAGCVPARGARHPAAVNGPRSDEEFAARRADYDALDVGAPARARERTRLEAYLLDEAAREIGRQRPERALDLFRAALTLWDADELWPRGRGRGGEKPGEARLAQDAQLLGAAHALEIIFQRRGGHQAVLLTLAVERTLGPDDGAARGRWRDVLAWTRLQDSAEHGSHQTMDDLESVVDVWPAPIAVDELARLYLDQIAQTGRGGREGLGDEFAEMFDAQPELAIHKLAALFLRVSRPESALEWLHRAAAAQAKVEESPLVGLLAKSVRPESQVREAITLAMVFARSENELPVAERICRDATRRFPKDDSPWLCVGEFAGRRGRLGVAMHAFEQALRLDPSTWSAWMALARLYHNRLFQLASDDKLGDLMGELGRIETLHAQARARFPERQLEPSMAEALYEVGRGYYNSGHVDEALRFVRQSIERDPSPQALEQLAQIELKRGHGRESVAACDRALLLVEKQENEAVKLYWQAKLERLRGDALDLAGSRPDALTAWHRSAEGWNALARLAPKLGAEERAEAELEHGKVLYLLGERQEAILSLERAIDAAPDRGVTYADVLAFLIPRGEREEALDAYHRALGRSEISEYLKTYFTLWMLDLDRRAGEPEDPLGHAFLAGLNGGQWYHELARWASGRASESDLLARADSPAKRSEAYFYQAMRALERGEESAARTLWHRVLDTEMMSYFEFDMASYYLRHGAGKPQSAPVPSAAPTSDNAI